jgi:acetoin utilization deacetylase AcuC-like enzyme
MAVSPFLQVMESSREATWSDCLTVHSSKYIEKLKLRLEGCESTALIDGDTQISRDSLNATLAASGAVLQGILHSNLLFSESLSAIDQVMDDSVSIKNAFCIVRPPGHHAGRDGLVHNSISQGFCLVNNIAIGAVYALQTYPEKIKKVAIVDIDVHHGDGTEHIVAGRNDILFISLHAFDGEFYPRTGNNKPARNIINCPLELRYGGELFFDAFMTHGHHALLKFKPDLILISAGFDARMGDVLTPFRFHRGLTAEDYYKMSVLLGKMASKLCDGRIVSALEGGYGTENLAECAVAHTSGLLDSALDVWLDNLIDS